MDEGSFRTDGKGRYTMEPRDKKAEQSPVSDEQIIELYLRRDEDAIRQTDVKYGSYLRKIAHNIVGDSGDCEECLNDTYLAVWNAIPPERPRVLQAFLAAIMRRTAINCYNAKHRQKRILSEYADSLSDFDGFLTDSESTDAVMDARELGRAISDFVRSLPERRMYIFMSRYYLARPIEEIAKTLKCSLSTVNKEIAAIKRGLKEKLESEGFTV